jgi:hypothetical protein
MILPVPLAGISVEIFHDLYTEEDGLILPFRFRLAYFFRKIYRFCVGSCCERLKTLGGALFPMPNFLCKPARMHLPGIPFLVAESPVSIISHLEEFSFRFESKLAEAAHGLPLPRLNLLDAPLGIIPNL